MATITGRMAERYKAAKFLDLLYSKKLTEGSTFIRGLDVREDKVIMMLGGAGGERINNFRVYNNLYGDDSTVQFNYETTDITLHAFDMIIVGKVIVAVGRHNIYFIDILDDGTLGRRQVVNFHEELGSGIHLKKFDRFAYLCYFNRFIMIDCEAKQIYTDQRFNKCINDVKILKKISAPDPTNPLHPRHGQFLMTFLFENEDGGSIGFWNNKDDETYTVVNQNILRFLIPNQQDFADDTDLSEMIYVDGTDTDLVVARLDGSVYHKRYSDSNMATWSEPAKKIFEISDLPQQILIHGSNVFLLHGYNEIFVYNLATTDMVTINLEGRPIEMRISEMGLFVLLDNLTVNMYKLSELPIPAFNYVRLETAPIRHQKTKKVTGYRHYLNCNVTLTNFIASMGTGEPANLTLITKNSSVTEKFYEQGQTRNVYLPITDADLAAIQAERSFNFLPAKALQGRIGSATGSSLDEVTFTYDKELPKVFIKDGYWYKDAVYFRLKYLYKGTYMMVVKLLDRVIYLYHFADDASPDTRESLLSGRAIEGLEWTAGQPLERPSKIYMNEAISDKYGWFQIPLDLASLPKQEKGAVEVLILAPSVTAEKVAWVHNVDPNKADEGHSMSYPLKFPKKNAHQIQAKGINGDIKVLHETELFDLEAGEKDIYIQNMSNVASEHHISTGSLAVAGKNDVLNGEVMDGYLSIPIEISKHHYSTYTAMVELYFFGKKAFNKWTRQKDVMNGIVRSYYPVNQLKGFIRDDFYQALAGRYVKSPFAVTATLRKKKLVNTEDLIVKHVVTNEFENQIELLQTNGIYFNFKISANMSSDRFRIFIKGRDEDFLTRINPESYSIKLDPEYNQALVSIKGATYLHEGMEIYIVSNSITDRTIYYDKIESPYDVDSLPLIQTTNGKYLVLTGKRAEDLDVNINGYTLIPGHDYKLLDSTDSNGHPVALIQFRNVIPKDVKIEINFLDEWTNHVRYFVAPAKGTDDIYIMDDDEFSLIEGTFEVFQNNLRLDRSQYEVLSNRTLRVTADPTVYKRGNLMIRFSYPEHTNMTDILNEYKYRLMDLRETYYHSKFTPDAGPSNFDILCGNKQSTASGKNYLQELLLKAGDRDGGIPAEKLILNANKDDLKVDIDLGAKEIDNPYVTGNMEIDCNEDQLSKYDYDVTSKPDLLNPLI